MENKFLDTPRVAAIPEILPNLSAMQKIAIFGGTFNPVHRGHLAVAEAGLQHSDRILWVVTQPHYKSAEITPYAQRRDMVELAIAPYPQYDLPPLAEHRYGIDIFHDLEQRYPHTQWYWLIGADAFQTLPRWHQAAELGDRCTWLVAPRSGQLPHEKPPNVQSNVQWQWLEMPQVEVSSSLIRRLSHATDDLSQWVPDPIHTYILEHHLYHHA
jgi:nicotinate-nucleotide adenylyltransferase